jgi:glycosyltransferase involved in cell wall biosynthesis
VTVHVGFLMAQVAGHVTYARNLRRVVEDHPDVDATWCDIAYHRPGGWVERVADVVGRGMVLRPVVEVARALQGRRFDAILLNTSAADVIQRPFLETPSIVDFDATPIQLAAMPEYGRDLGSRPVAEMRLRRKRRLWNGIARLQAWSEWAKASAVDDYGVDPDRVTVNPPGVDTDLWSPGTPGERRDGPVRILFVGGDFRRKGGDVLLDWFRRARPAGTELHLVTRERVDPAPGVTIHAGVEPNSERLVGLYRASDVFVLPSRAECFGIATVEAMATGLPVVVTDVGASREIVAEGENGHLVRPGRPDELGEALDDLVRDAARREAMAAASRRIVEDRFELRANAARTVRTLITLAGKSETTATTGGSSVDVRPGAPR